MRIRVVNIFVRFCMNSSMPSSETSRNRRGLCGDKNSVACSLLQMFVISSFVKKPYILLISCIIARIRLNKAVKISGIDNFIRIQHQTLMYIKEPNTVKRGHWNIIFLLNPGFLILATERKKEGIHQNNNQHRHLQLFGKKINHTWILSNLTVRRLLSLLA